MNVKIKKVVGALIIAMITMLSATFVSASSFEFNAYAQKEVFRPGEDVFIDMNIDSIEAGKEGINVVEMDLEYDKNVFESMEFIKKNDWNYDYNDDENSAKYGKLLFTNISSGVTRCREYWKY